MVMKGIMMMRVIMKIMNSSSYRRVLPIVAPILQQKLTILLSASTVVETLLLIENVTHGFGY